MRSFQALVADWPDDAVPPIILGKDELIAGLQATDFAHLALFEMVGDTFQSAMNEYVRQLRREASGPLVVLVLVESPTQT